mgnify:CR=1 FL=1
MKFKTIFAKMTACSLMLTALFGCGQASQTADGAQDTRSAQTTELTVFAAASMTETLNQIAEDYKTVEPNVSLTFNFASSGDLLSQIKEGADCDVFISAAPKQMNALDGSLKDDTDKNPDGLDELLDGTRIDLLENKVVLAVPEGNPKNIDSFDKLADRLGAGEGFLAIGNSDVPVGQYTRKIFAHYGLDEQSLADAGVLTYGSNVKEVTTQVIEGSVDAGVVYCTDAYSAGLTPVDEATKEMCGQVIYPAAVLKAAPNAETAKEFLAYLQTDKAMTVFEGVGFSAV